MNVCNIICCVLFLFISLILIYFVHEFVDCSGFVYYVYQQFGVTLNRVAADQMSNGVAVSVSDMRPGDIVGFHNKSGYVNHIGIYVGGGMMIHAPQSGETVRFESVVTGNYSLRINGVRRIFN